MGKEVHPLSFRHKSKDYEYLYIETEAGLLELVQMGAIEIHPWGAQIDSINRPDRLIFDLDPAPDVPFGAVKLAALDVRARLKALGLAIKLRCTGGKRLHVWVPLQTGITWPELKRFAAAVAHQMVKDLPDVYVATMTKAKRTGRIFVDYFRNDYTATAIADYSVRARPGAPVAVPLSWNELDALRSADQFRIPDVVKRVRGKRKTPSVATGLVPMDQDSETRLI